ncbi:hypothetical protein R1T08_00660 [Streptomyces sp. SBC-4]|nr:hypothetical protein [Streptomyces sp. SBC-4]MDV5142874.1 hypothetical protein [Streptomyces sp. SBC-4]
MSSIQKLLKGLEGKEEKYAQAKFTLGVIQRLTEARRDEFREEAMLLAAAPPGPVRIKADPYDFRYDMFMQVKTAPDDQITNIIDSIFGGSDPDFKKLAGNLLKSALNVLLGNVSTGISQKVNSFLTLDGDNIIRVDSMLWRYNFEYKGLTADAENAFFYGISLSVVKVEEMSDALLRLMVSHMVNQMTWLKTREEKEKERTRLWDLFKSMKDEALPKMQTLSAMSAKINEKVKNPSSLGLASSGNVYLACPDTATVWLATPRAEVEVAAGGGESTDDDIPAVKAKLDRPMAVAVHPHQEEFVIAEYGGRVRKVTKDGTIRTIFDGARDNPKDPVRPTHVSVSKEGDVHVVARQEGDEKTPLRIITITAKGDVTVHKQSEFTSEGKLSHDVHGVLATGEGERLLAISGERHVSRMPAGKPELQVVCGGGTDTRDGSQAKQTLLRYPCGLARGTVEGHLYIADGHDGEGVENSRVRKVTKAGKVTTVARGANIYALAVDEQSKALFTLCDSYDGEGRRFKAQALPSPVRKS